MRRSGVQIPEAAQNAQLRTRSSDTMSRVPSTATIHPAPWWQRIRGARAISWQSIVGGDSLISIAIVATGGTLGGYSSGPDSLLRALVVVTIVGVVAALWAFLGFAVLFRRRKVHPVNLWTYVLFYSVNGTWYFLGVQWLDVTSGSPSGIGWGARLASSITISLAWAIAVSLILESSDRFKARRQELLDELVAADVERLRESEEALHLREALDAQVDDALASTRASLNRALAAQARSPLDTGVGIATDANSSEAADIVRSAASDVVRPLSHQLQRLASTTYPPPRVSGAIRQWWLHPRMPPLATALLVSFQTTAESVRNFGGLVGPLASLLYFAALYIFLIGVDRAGRRLPRWNRLIYVVGVIGSLASNLWFAEGLSPEAANPGDAIANVVVSLVYILVTSLFDAVRQARAGLISTLMREVDEEEVRARALQVEMASIVDSMSRALHGRVQTQLVVCAAELERAARVGDHEAVTTALRHASSALASATRPPQITLSDLVYAWTPLLSIHVESPGVSAETLARADVIAVVEEGLANAYRHGHASNVTVVLTPLPHALRIVVADDGTGIGDDATGLGSQMLRRLSQGRMTLISQAPGAVLTVELPLEIDAT